MSQKNYTDVALNTTQQLGWLHNKGLLIPDPECAVHYLKVVSYHRFSSYFTPFKFYGSTEWKFKPSTTFDDIWKIYIFDGDLRLLVVEALEKIEIAFRTALSNAMCLRHEPHWYLNSALFKRGDIHEVLLKKIKHICERRDDSQIQRYYKQYCHPGFPPCWIIIEHLDFGTCTNTFNNLKHLGDKKSICEIFSYHPTAIESWIDALRYTRNLCAHHARLWNRWFVTSPKLTYLYGKGFDKENTFYEQAIVIERLLQIISPGTHWRLKLYNLLNSNPFIPAHKMGFAENWRDDPFWANLAFITA